VTKNFIVLKDSSEMSKEIIQNRDVLVISYFQKVCQNANQKNKHSLVKKIIL